MILHCITNFEEYGGAEGALIRLINHSNSLNHIVVSLRVVSPKLKEKITNPNCKFFSLNSSGILSFLFTTLSLFSILRQENPKKVYSWMYHANFISALCVFIFRLKVPLIWCIRHSLDDFNGENLSTKLAILFCNRLKFIPYKSVYCSQSSMHQHISFGHTLINKSFFIPNGYTFKDFYPRTFKSDYLVIGFAGRFHQSKDLATLLKAYNNLLTFGIPCYLRMCGRGITYDNYDLIKLICDSGLNISDVSLLGEIDDVHKFYDELDIFVLSSKNEGFPNVLAEAAASGCAVFSTNVGDASCIINNKEHVVSVKDFKSLSQSIYNFIQKPHHEKQSICSLTTKHVRKNFAIENISKQFLEL